MKKLFLLTLVLAGCAGIFSCSKNEAGAEEPPKDDPKPNDPQPNNPDPSDGSGNGVKDSVVLVQEGIRLVVQDSTSFKYQNQTYRVGDTIFGHKGYVYMVVGHPHAQLILSSPHDGNQNGSPEIPDRITDDTMVRDLNTTELATEIGKGYKAESGTAPYLVVNRIWRRKVEPNRAPNDTDHKHLDAIETYNSYHTLLTVARMLVTHHREKGLVADIHGHGLDVPRIHLGYLVPKANFYRGADLSNSGSTSSIKSIAAASSLPFESLVRGNESLGGILVTKGFRAYPSPVDAVPTGISDKYTTSGQTYFNGAYIVEKHGSKNGGNISAVQMEFYREGIRDTPGNRALAGGRIGNALYQYMLMHQIQRK